ncbi:DUF551 domain-containing protein [Klebsiella quasipneumoniae]|uniref:Eaa1 n=1 Tax=Klebsiella quasipneumoniae TaxID=1463165 RepID=A0ABD7N5G5_9ENTR|nr:DUF551 domain-containing protein [Klebsiella quasipneumoniae]SSF97948.1 Eaa1 [Klebsiella quasipneumoniae]SSG52261.1 Eaa1 [Klebsiella quasipneumoniae]
MNKSTITRDELNEVIATYGKHHIAHRMANVLLAAMDSEPVAVIDLANLDYLRSGADADVWPPEREEMGDVLLYRHPQPAPVVSAELLHTAASAIEDLLTTKDRMGVYVCFDLPFRLRSAANAQPAPAAPVCTCPSGDGSLRWPCPVHPGNSPVIPDGWTGNEKANAALMMLDRIETVDPVDDDRIDGIKRIVRELAAAPHDTPALNSVQSVVTVPGKWIPVSERMPEVGVKVLCFPAEDEPIHAVFNGQLWLQDVSWSGSEEPIDNVIPVTVTHWMPLPAGPQEVR